MTQALDATPSVEYGLLSPMLIVLGVAVVGVLVEAFLPRQQRYAAQLVLSLGGLVAAFVAVVATGPGPARRHGRTAVMGAVAVDAPALFLQGTILLVGVLGILLIAERRISAPADRRAGGQRPGRVHPAGLGGRRAASPRSWPPRPASCRPRCSR